MVLGVRYSGEKEFHLIENVKRVQFSIVGNTVLQCQAGIQYNPGADLTTVDFLERGAAALEVYEDETWIA